MTVKQMTYLVIRKIKSEGIKERNVFIAALNDNIDWVLNEFQNMEINYA